MQVPWQNFYLKSDGDLFYTPIGVVAGVVTGCEIAEYAYGSIDHNVAGWSSGSSSGE